jgi:NTE family protein
VATAVAASAAFPAFLPAIDRKLEFENNGARSFHRVIVTDGGVYDNFGITCMLPGRSSEFSTNAFPVDYIIVCDAGAGIPTGARRPYLWPTRMMATLFTIHRRTQTLMQDLLHRMKANNEIDGFLMPYLGQNDTKLPFRPADLVSRAETFDYPTNFSAMSQENIRKLSQRGEQLTQILLEAYATHL